MSNQDNHNGPPPGGPPGTDTIPDNPNQHISTMGMITTLLINIGVFVLVQWIFEVNRFYKQIYLKRLQKRFEEIGRVPPIPPHHVFGWLKALYDVSEMDVLRMVGLDAYMLLRYHVVCWKLSLFMSFWGIVALTPIYSTATNNIFETGSLQVTIDSRSYSSLTEPYIHLTDHCHHQSSSTRHRVTDAVGPLHVAQRGQRRVRDQIPPMGSSGVRLHLRCLFHAGG